MYKVVSKKNGKYGIQDTKDGVIEYFTREELIKIRDVYKLKVMNIDKAINDISSNNVDMDFVARKIISKFSGYSMKEIYYSDEDNPSKSDKVNISFRDWGDWVLPDDIDEDEVEDYDWEELSRESYIKLKNIIKELQSQFSNVAFDIDIGEKNWITITASYK